MAQRLMSLMRSFFRLENRSSFRLESCLQTSIWLERLPDEMLVRIFSYLTIQELCLLRDSHVSTRIRRICNDKSLWKKVDLSGQKVKAEFIKTILENGCENLNLQNTLIDGSIKLSKISKLTYLELERIERYRIGENREVSKSFFNEILLSCRSLQKLVLGEPAYDLALLQRIFSQNGQTLQALNFGAYYDTIFKWSCTSILELDFWMQSMIFVKLILTHCTKLQEINLEYCDLHHDALNQLVSGLSPEIEKVSLPGNDEVTDEHIETLVSRCNKITALDIGSGYGRRIQYCDISCLTNNAITSILNHLKNLTELDVTGCSNITLEKVLELESLQLQVLNFGFNKEMNSKYLDEMPGLMKKLPHLIINKKENDIIISVGGRIAKI